jgi:hypothetical protein
MARKAKLKIPPGQQDPWKRRPVREEPVDADEVVIGTASSDHPLDQDLKHATPFVLRAPGQDYTLLVLDAINVEAAVHALLRAAQNPAVDQVLREAGFTQAPRAEVKPQGFVLFDTERVLWCATAQGSADGFRRLVQALLQECRRDRLFKDRLAELGLRPLLP